MLKQILIFSCLFLYSTSLFDNSKIIKPLTKLKQYYNIRDGNSDHLSFLFFYEENCQKCNYFESMIDEIGDTLNGIVDTYGVNCDVLREEQENLPDNERIVFCDPENNDYLPQIFLYEPPQQSYNPYTQEKIQAIEVNLQLLKYYLKHGYQGQVKVNAIKDFAKEHIPAFREEIKSIKDLDEFLKFNQLPNKLLLFTDKKETPLMFKGMTSIFRDRIDFGEIRKENEEVVKKYSITKFPTLLMLSYDQETKKYKEQIYTGLNKFNIVREFLEDFALEQKIQRKNNMGYNTDQPVDVAANEFSIRKYQKSILKEEKMVLMYIYKPGEIEKESKQNAWAQIMNKFGDVFMYFTFEIDSEQKQKFAETDLFVKKTPIIKLFPIGTTKKQKSKFFFDDEISVESFKKEVSDILEDNSRGISTLQQLQLYTVDSIKDNKIPVIMLHSGYQTTISYRSLTHLTLYTNFFNFYTVQNPSNDLMQTLGITKLPSLMALTKNEQENYVHLMFKGKFVYDQLILFLNQITENHVGKNENQQAKTKEIVQLQVQEDFEKKCLHKSSHCFIAFLDLRESTKSEKLQTQIEMLEDLSDKFAEKKAEFMWIDAICHRYLLERLNLSEDDIPQLVYYNPQKNIYGSQVGTFTFDGLSAFIRRALKSSISTTKISEEIDIDEINCQQAHESYKQTISGYQKNSQEDDEILKEILQEEKEKQKVLEKEGNKKSKQKKKKGKKKNNAKKEEL